MAARHMKRRDHGRVRGDVEAVPGDVDADMKSVHLIPSLRKRASLRAAQATVRVRWNGGRRPSLTHGLTSPRRFRSFARHRKIQSTRSRQRQVTRRFGISAPTTTLMANLSNDEVAGRDQRRARRASSFDRLGMRRFGNIASSTTLMVSPSNHEIAGRDLHHARRASSFDRLRMRRIGDIASPSTLMVSLSNHEISGRDQHRASRPRPSTSSG